MALTGHEPRAVVGSLRERGVNTLSQVRAYAVLDYDAKGVTASLRVSPHYYNTEAEVETLAVELAAILAVR